MDERRSAFPLLLYRPVSLRSKWARPSDVGLLVELTVGRLLLVGEIHGIQIVVAAACVLPGALADRWRLSGGRWLFVGRAGYFGGTLQVAVGRRLLVAV